MKTSARPLNRADWTKLIVGMTLLFSLFVRLFPAIMTGFPINDGGMFLVMIRDLRSNGFALPAYTSYNLLDIPYAYPPLGFYIAGLLSSAGIPDIEILRWLPVLVNLASIPAFFLLARTLLKDEPLAAVATMVYGMVPGNFAWQIMGGGLTRALGILFLLLALYHVFKMFENGTRQAWKHVGLSALFCSLAVLSHPEVSLATASSCAFFWLVFGRSRTGLLRAGVVAFGTLVLTAPWWASILSVHGLAPFQAVFHSGAYHGNPFLDFLSGLLTFTVWDGLFRLLVLAALVWNLPRKQWFLPAWLALPYLVEPRSAPAFAYFPASILAAQALMILLPQAYEWFQTRRRCPAGPFDPLQPRFTLLIFTLVFLWFLQGAFYGFMLRNTSLRPPIPQETMRWVHENTPAESEFIILTGKDSGIMTDPIQEWFPALAKRRSNTTLQGLEWTLGPQFFPRLQELMALQTCTDLQCVEGWSSETGLVYDYVLIEKNNGTSGLLHSIGSQGGYELIYENDAYLIFKRGPAFSGPLPAS